MGQTGGCKKRKRGKKASSGIRKTWAGQNRPKRGGITFQLRWERRIKDMPIDLSKCLTHEQRFNKLPKDKRKKIYGVTVYPF